MCAEEYALPLNDQNAATSEQWKCWIAILENVLCEADITDEMMFGIYLSSAIEEAHKQINLQISIAHTSGSK
jgi:hypothetical protein